VDLKADGTASQTYANPWWTSEVLIEEDVPAAVLSELARIYFFEDNFVMV
jgi:hypothetical protein